MICGYLWNKPGLSWNHSDLWLLFQIFALLKLQHYPSLLLQQTWGFFFFFFFFQRWGIILTGSLSLTSGVIVGTSARSEKIYRWSLVFIFRVNLLLLLCLSEEEVSHVETNEHELPNPRGMTGSLHLLIACSYLNIPFPYKIQVLFCKYPTGRFCCGFDPWCFAMV